MSQGNKVETDFINAFFSKSNKMNIDICIDVSLQTRLCSVVEASMATIAAFRCLGRQVFSADPLMLATGWMGTERHFQVSPEMFEPGRRLGHSRTLTELSLSHRGSKHSGSGFSLSVSLYSAPVSFSLNPDQCSCPQPLTNTPCSENTSFDLMAWFFFIYIYICAEIERESHLWDLCKQVHIVS